MNKEKEKELISFIDEIIRLAKTEMTKLSRNPKFRNICKLIEQSKQFFRKNDIAVVSSDKTKNLLVEATYNLVARYQ